MLVIGDLLTEMHLQVLIAHVDGLTKQGFEWIWQVSRCIQPKMWHLVRDLSRSQTRDLVWKGGHGKSWKNEHHWINMVSTCINWVSSASRIWIQHVSTKSPRSRHDTNLVPGSASTADKRQMQVVLGWKCWDSTGRLANGLWHGPFGLDRGIVAHASKLGDHRYGRRHSTLIIHLVLNKHQGWENLTEQP